MCPDRVGAHAGGMFTSYHLHRALAADRQQTLRHEARQHHLVRLARRARSNGGRVIASGAEPGEAEPSLSPAVAVAEWEQERRAA